MIHNYKSLLMQHGCAACAHRYADRCTHPGAPNLSSLRGTVSAFVEASCGSGSPQVRPHWCPFPMKEWILKSEEEAKDSKQHEEPI